MYDGERDPDVPYAVLTGDTLFIGDVGRPDLRASLPAGMRPDLDPLRELLETHRAKALRSTRRELRTRRTGDALAEWDTFVSTND